MTTFYNSVASSTCHVDGIGRMRTAIFAFTFAMVDLCGLPTCSSNFVGGTHELTNDVTFQALVQPSGDLERFGEMMAAVMTATDTVLERPYKKF